MYLLVSVFFKIIMSIKKACNLNNDIISTLITISVTSSFNNYVRDSVVLV